MTSHKKKDFFLESLKHNAHYHREWVIRAFTVTISQTTEPWFINHHPDKVTYNHPTLGEVVLEDCVPYDIPFVYHEHTGPLKAGDVLNLKTGLEDTTWGIILLNARVLCFACGDRIPFMQGPFEPSDIEKIFIEKMQDNPKEGEPADPDALYVYHWLAVGKAVGDLDGLELFIPSITEKALQPYPELKEHRAEVISRYTKEELEDPVIQVKIEKELVTRHREYLAGDASEGFLIKAKTIDTCIKQMFLIHGPEAGFSEGGRATLVPTSLDEGINIKYFSEMMNSQRAGSYFRGAMTALAGTDVDLIGRIFQTVRITPEFCGTHETLRNTPVTSRYLERWMEIDGKRVQLTTDNIDAYKNTRQNFYDPSFCKEGSKQGVNDVCPICIGGKLARYPTSLGSAVAEKQSIMMSVMMGSAHAKSLKTKPLLDNWLE